MAPKLVTTPYDALTYKIIGCAMAVHRKLGPGYREDTYQRDLEVHFAAAGLSFRAQALLEVHDSSQGGVQPGLVARLFARDVFTVLAGRSYRSASTST